MASASVPRRRRLSMKALLTLATVGLVTLTVVGVAGLVEHNARRLLVKEMETRLVLEARHLALLSTDALLAPYPELTLFPVVKEMIDQQPHLTLAAVLDHEGRVQGHPDARLLGQPLSVLEGLRPEEVRVKLQPGEAILGDAEVVVARVPVRHAGGQHLGTVVVGQSRAYVSSMLAGTRRQVMILAASLAAACGLAAALFMRRLLRPVDFLRAGLTRIGHGDLDTPINLTDRTDIGLLAEAIDAMAAKLKATQEEAAAKEQEIIQTQRELIHTLGEVVESRSNETANHTSRVGQAAAKLAELAGLAADEVDTLWMAAPMHDVGKIGIPDAILNKPGKLTDAEYEVMKTHAAIGHQILAQSPRELLQAAAVVAHEHHERWDGQGYPQGLAGDDIHVFGRIVSIVDVFDALTSDRVYRPAMPLAKALDIILEGRGTQFDPNLLDLFFSQIGFFIDLIETSNTEAAVTASAQPVASGFEALLPSSAPADSTEEQEEPVPV